MYETCRVLYSKRNYQHIHSRYMEKMKQSGGGGKVKSESTVRVERGCNHGVQP